MSNNKRFQTAQLTKLYCVIALLHKSKLLKPVAQNPFSTAC
jgi:hypothetical protein